MSDEKGQMKRVFFVVCAIFLVFGLAGCASTPKEVPYQEISIQELPKASGANIGQKFVFSSPITIRDNGYFDLSTGEFRQDTILPHLAPSLDLARERIEPDKEYTFYVTVCNDEDYHYLFFFPIEPPSSSYNYFRIDRIEGLMPIEEAQAKLDRINAEKKAVADAKAAEEAAKKAAQEEADRYDPAKFVVVSSDFRPSQYTKVDLFTAVAASEKLEVMNNIGTYVWTPSKTFVSEVVFVSQNGTDIIFRTDDNAITQRMKVDSRTGLSAGQRVRIYYTAYRVKDWQIVAIERL